MDSKSRTESREQVLDALQGVDLQLCTSVPAVLEVFVDIEHENVDMLVLSAFPDGERVLGKLEVHLCGLEVEGSDRPEGFNVAIDLVVFIAELDAMLDSVLPPRYPSHSIDIVEVAD